MDKFRTIAILKDVKLQGGKQDTHEHLELRLPFAADLEVASAQALLEHGTPYLGEDVILTLEACAGAREFSRTIGTGQLKKLGIVATEDAGARVALELAAVVELTEAEHLFSDLLPQRGYMLVITGRPVQQTIPGFNEQIVEDMAKGLETMGATNVEFGPQGPIIHCDLDKANGAV